MSSNLRITKVCDHCKGEFEARTLHTRYCSHRCNQRHYKILKREEKLRVFIEHSAADSSENQPANNFQSDNLSVTELQEKDYLSISETAIYLGVSKRTIERAIASGKLTVVRVNRRVIIPKESISKLLGV